MTDTKTPAGTTRVTLAGKDYLLRGDTDPDFIRDVASFVDKRLSAARERSDQPHDIARMAILTSLNIAHELFAERAARSQEQEDFSRKLQELTGGLTRCLDEKPGESGG